MGQKVHPTGFRLGVIRGWDSRWYASNRNYKDLLAEDQRLRALINRRLANAGVSRIEIERVASQLSITIHTARPGIVIGKSGESVERLRQTLEAETKKKVRLTILEIRTPEVESILVARSIAEQLEKRISFRRAMKQAVQKAMRANAKGIKIVVGGRLGGAEIARVEKEVEGSVPLQTLRANIDYGQAEAHTTYGVVGIKVWIYHGDILPEKQRELGMAATKSSGTPVTAGGERGGDRGPRMGGDRGPRGGGDRGPRGPRADRGDRGGARPGGERGGRGGIGAPGAQPGRPAPGGGPSRSRGPREGGIGTPVGHRPASGVPPVTPEAQAEEQTGAGLTGSPAQAMAQPQQEPAPSVPENTAPKNDAPNPDAIRPEEEA